MVWHFIINHNVWLQADVAAYSDDDNSSDGDQDHYMERMKAEGKERAVESDDDSTGETGGS